MIGGQAGLLLYYPFGVIENLARHHAAIDDDNANARLTVVEHKTAGVQFIVDVGGLVIAESAIDRHSQPGRYVAGRSAGAKLRRCQRDLRGNSREDQEENEINCSAKQTGRGVHILIEPVRGYNASCSNRSCNCPAQRVK